MFIRLGEILVIVNSVTFILSRLISISGCRTRIVHINSGGVDAISTNNTIPSTLNRNKPQLLISRLSSQQSLEQQRVSS